MDILPKISIDSVKSDLLNSITELPDITGGVLDGTFSGAFNIRADGQAVARHSSENVTIVPKKGDQPGIDIYIKAGTVGETVYIPVVMTKPGQDTVYNDFHIGEASDVTIIAGCGIHNESCTESRHDGIHTFWIEKNAKVLYVEKHYGEGNGQGTNVMNPVTIVHMEKNSYMDMETTQIKGVDSTDRQTKADLGDGATIVVGEKIMTHGKQFAKTDFTVDLNGKNSSANIVSRSVAKGESVQSFHANMCGNNECMGHSECDAIIMDQAVVTSTPEITARCVDASLVHEAAIGKIAGEQIEKLMTLGLTEAEAEEQIINGFMK